jgi:HEAT repeat protein/energy-coupling factor transporter ATP-binding protein EcfA2
MPGLCFAAVTWGSIYGLWGDRRTWGALSPLAWLAAKQPAWQFDLISAAIGFVLGLLLALFIYLLRERIQSLRSALVTRVWGVREQISKGVADRYREQIVQMAEQAHLLMRYAPLSGVYVEPRLVVPHANPLSERLHEGGARDERWRLLCLHDILHRSVRWTDLASALRQHTRLAILGSTGSGRTTLLAHLAWMFAQGEGWRLLFNEPQETDPVEVRAGRERERGRIPVWVSFDSLDLTLTEQQGRHVLLEPVVEYLSVSLRRLIASTSASLVRAQLIQGKCILLLDNLETLSPDAQREALDWVHKLTRTYPENQFVIAGIPEGYGRLWEIGFAPLMLEGFHQSQVSQFVSRWEALYEEVEIAEWRAEVEQAKASFDEEVARARLEGRPPPSDSEFSPPPMPERRRGLLTMWHEGHRERVMPLDLALAALLWRVQGEVPSAALMRHAQAVLIALDRIQDSPLSPPQWARVLASVAWTMQQEERLQAHRSELEKPVAEILVQANAGTVASPAEGEQQERQPPDFDRAARAALDGLLKMGDLLLDVGRGRVAFVHPTFGAYFAAQHAARHNLSDEIIAHVHDPGWQDTVLFYSALSKVVPLVMARLKETDDLFRSNFFAAAAYLAASPDSDRRLHGGVLAELARIFLDPMQPNILRRRAAGTIADAGEKGALSLFGQALRHADAHVRRMGVWGLAQMDDPRLIEGLIHCLSDKDLLVRVEALYALGALGGEQVIDGLIRGLQDLDELARRVAAEALAAVGGEGLDVLRQAVESTDMYIRRAAVYGLGQVGEAWAVSIVAKVSTDDGEWFVRSAAGEALDQARADPPALHAEPPHLEDEEWLVTWAAQQGIGVGTASSAFQALLRAVSEGDWLVRLAAADTLRTSGGLEAIEPLEAVLHDEDILIREAVFAALYEIGLRAGVAVRKPQTD